MTAKIYGILMSLWIGCLFSIICSSSIALTLKSDVNYEAKWLIDGSIKENFESENRMQRVKRAVIEVSDGSGGSKNQIKEPPTTSPKPMTTTTTAATTSIRRTTPPSIMFTTTTVPTATAPIIHTTASSATMKTTAIEEEEEKEEDSASNEDCSEKKFPKWFRKLLKKLKKLMKKLSKVKKSSGTPKPKVDCNE